MPTTLYSRPHYKGRLGHVSPAPLTCSYHENNATSKQASSAPRNAFRQKHNHSTSRPHVSPRQLRCGARTLPLQLPVDPVLLQQTLVVRLQCLHVRHRIPLGVEIKAIELLHHRKRLTISRTLELLVRPSVMPRVERMEPNHVQAHLRNRATILLQHPVHVLIMTPSHHQVRDTASLLIDPVLRGIHRILVVRVARKMLREHTFLRELAPHREGVPHHTPLRLTP
mmetsp:Transcript_12525/g.29876  ORF Transcript_12525/g.29876 Transcript_12525/m.29876 type:complete len:225 (-) Transcript_12525:418-1092(-)